MRCECGEREHRDQRTAEDHHGSSFSGVGGLGGLGVPKNSAPARSTNLP